MATDFLATDFAAFMAQTAAPLQVALDGLARASKGGPGSGNWHHAGRPGLVGGSAPGTGGQPAGKTKPPRAGLPGLPPHAPEWHEAEGLLPGRLALDFKQISDDSYESGWESPLHSRLTPTVRRTMVDLTHPDWPDSPKQATYLQDTALGHITRGKDDIGWPAAIFTITDPRYSGDVPEFFKDFSKDETGIWRGMMGEELQASLARGYLQSRGAMNLSGQEGLTYFSNEPGMALTYASSFAPWTSQPTFETPSYVVRARRPPTKQLSIYEGTPGEIGVRGQVPATDVTEIWEIRLAAETPNRITARLTKNTGQVQFGHSG